MPDALAAFYLVCFLIGLIFVLVSALIGLSHDVAHLPGLHHGSHVGDFAADVGHGGADAGHGDAGAAAEGQPASGVVASPLNLMTVMAFLTWFGGAGYILHAMYGVFLPLSLIGGVSSGLLAGWLVYLFLVKVLLRGTAPPDPREYQVVGNLARVIIAIPPGGIGEVVYTMGGSRHSDGARSVDGLPIPRGTEVVIARYERGIAYVQPWRRFLESASADDQPG